MMFSSWVKNNEDYRPLSHPSQALLGQSILSNHHKALQIFISKFGLMKIYDYTYNVEASFYFNLKPHNPKNLVAQKQMFGN